MRNRIFLALAFYCFLGTTATAQTTAFTYQGKLTDGGTPANGQYDLQVKLFDAPTEGTQQGTTLTLSNVAVVNGVFTVQLDFGACASCFSGAARYLEIAVKKTTDAAFVTLTPRQPVSSTPYAMKTRNLSFNGAYDDGNGTVFTAINTFTGEGAGVNTTPSPGLGSAFGKFNSFYGAGAGKENLSGFHNAFFGSQAGQSNAAGLHNAFFGSGAGYSSESTSNAFFGSGAGFYNTTGGNNTFIGTNADFNVANPTGFNNTLLGSFSKVISGSNNATAIGFLAQVSQSNSLVLGSINGVNGCTPDNSCDSVKVGIGTTAPATKLHISGSGIIRARINSDSSAGVALTLNDQPGWSVATVSGGQLQIFNDAIGQNAMWINSATNNVGIGTTAPNFKLTVSDSSNTGLRVATATTGGTVASFGGFGAFEIDSPGFVGGRLRVAENGLVTVGRSGVGGDLTVFGNTILNTVTIANGATLNVLGAAGSTSLCRNASNQISTCSSSLRYKQNIHAFASGLSLVNRLRPVTFNWKTNNEPDLGLVAEEVAKVEPLLVTRNDKGEIEGVKYDRVAVVLLNAIKEQQAQLQAQQEQLRERERQAAAQQSRLAQYESHLRHQQQEFAALKRVVCASLPRAEGCRATKRKK
jgi:hypothetical protein